MEIWMIIPVVIGIALGLVLLFIETWIRQWWRLRHETITQDELVVQGKEVVKAKFEQALEFIAKHSDYYNVYVRKHIAVICTGAKSAYCEANVFKRQMFYNEPYFIDSINSNKLIIMKLASNIVHEAAHIEDYLRRTAFGRAVFIYSGKPVELYALREQKKFLETVPGAQGHIYRIRIKKLIKEVEELRWYKFWHKHWRWVYLSQG